MTPDTPSSDLGNQQQRRLAVVDFMVISSIASRLENLPTDQSTPVDDKVIIFGDFKARLDQDADFWKGVLSRHGVGNYNDNGRLLLDLCTMQQLVIPSTIFQQKDRLKTNWMYPRFKYWHRINYVLVHKRDLKYVIHTKVIPSAEFHTDHHLLRCKIRLHFKSKPRKGGILKKNFNLSKLQSAKGKADFQAGQQSKFKNICLKDTSPETLRDQLKSAIPLTSEEVLGFFTKKNKE